ncbi:hypothetical protein [Duganella hordei]|uniref:hypothetical protein n=1 Tax=Duganella hordei TaxID=2865934 RepID=UPI0030E821E6
MNTTNHLGNLGEDVVSQLFRRKINDVYRFSVTFLGEKTQFLDFIVNLLDGEGAEYGPFFFLQVKTTTKVPGQGRGISARFSAKEVRTACARKVPVYLVAVGCLSDDSEEIFAMAVDASLQGGVAVVPRIFSLSMKETRLRIYDEVHAYFQAEMPVFESQLTRKAYAFSVRKEGK